MEIGEKTDGRKDYQALVESVTDYVIAINKDFRIIMANNLFKNEFGIEPDSYCYSVWKKREKRCEQCPVKKSFKDGKVHWDEEFVKMKDGRRAKMLIKSTPVRDDRGDILFALETATDLSQKKHLQQELKKATNNIEQILFSRLKELEKSEERYRTIFERSRDSIILIDSLEKIIDINSAGIELLGFNSKEEVLSLHSSGTLFVRKKDLKSFREMSLRSGVVKEFEARLSGKGSRIFDALLSSNVILDAKGHISGYVTIIRDITGRKKFQLQIERQNARLATLNSISMEVSSSLKLDEVLRSTVDKVLEITESQSVRIYLLDRRKKTLNLFAQKGLSEEFVAKDFIKSREVGVGFLGGTVLTGETKIMDNLLQAESPHKEALLREGLMSTAYIPLVSKGKSVGVMCVSSHIFKFSPEYLEFLAAIGNQIGVAVDNANLYENLKTAYHELKKAKEQIIRTEKLASLGKLAATIAHEINNPLAAVLTYLRLMMKLLDRGMFTPERIEDISRYLETMESEITRCGEIVKNLLAFSRRSPISLEIQSIDGILEKTIAIISHDLEMKKIKLVKNFEKDLPKVKCDFKQLQQAFLNLISNASEAMPHGGTITLDVKPSKDNDFLEIMISDTGCGISAKDLENIFEPFFTTKEEGKGVGLGLSVVYGIITYHNGAITVESSPEKGTDFTVRLPVAE